MNIVLRKQVLFLTNVIAQTLNTHMEISLSDYFKFNLKIKKLKTKVFGIWSIRNGFIYLQQNFDYPSAIEPSHNGFKQKHSEIIFGITKILLKLLLHALSQLLFTAEN